MARLVYRQIHYIHFSRGRILAVDSKLDVLGAIDIGQTIDYTLGISRILAFTIQLLSRALFQQK